MKFPNLDAEISAYMRREHITQAEMAERMGMAENTFSWKRRGSMGREFSLGETARLADLMGKSIDYLCGRVPANA